MTLEKNKPLLNNTQVFFSFTSLLVGSPSAPANQHLPPFLKHRAVLAILK